MQNDLQKYYESKLEAEFQNNINDYNNRIKNIYYDACFQIVVNNFINALKAKPYTIIDFLNLSNQTYIDKNNQESFIKKMVHIICSWIMSSIIGYYLMGADLLIELAYNYYEYQISSREIKAIQGQLTPSHKKHKKYRRIKRIIIIKNYDELNEQQLIFLNFIEYLINEKYIHNTLMIKFSQNHFQNTYSLILEKNEINHLLNTTLITNNNIQLFKNLSIEYFPVLLSVIDESSNIQKHKIFEKVIFNIIKNSTYYIPQEEIYNFLKLCSYLFPHFNQKDIEINFSQFISNIVLCLNEAEKTTIISHTQNYYFYTQTYIRTFFDNEVQNILTITQKDCLYQYLTKTYYNQYYNIVLASIKLDQNINEIHSNIFITLYYKKFLSQHEHKELEQIMKQYYNNSFIYTYKICIGEDIVNNITKLLHDEQYDSLNNEGKLAVLGIILPKSYEFYGLKNKRIIQKYIQIFNLLHIILSPNPKYYSYIIDCIILSTAIEMSTREKIVIDRLSNFIKLNNNALNKTDYIRYLRFANYLSENPEPLLEEGFYITSDDPIEHELFRINYSVSLAFSEKYIEAFRLLKDKNILSLKEIHFNGYISYENNKSVINILLHNIQKNPFTSLLKKIKQKPTYGDYMIIKNNYIAFKIKMNQFILEENKKMIKEILDTQDQYHIFFLQYNLLIYFYKSKKEDDFDFLYSLIKIPQLLKSYHDFFLDKIKEIKILKDHHKYLNDDQLKTELNKVYERYSDLRIGTYKEIILFGLIERWYE